MSYAHEVRNPGGWALLAVWMILIFLLSHEPATVSSARSGHIIETVRPYLLVLSVDDLTNFVRKSAHIIAYFILGALSYNVMRSYALSKCATILTAISIALFYAISDELHQIIVPGRSGEIRDVLIDVTGAAIGIGVYYGFLKYWPKNKRIINTKDSND